MPGNLPDALEADAPTYEEEVVDLAIELLEDRILVQLVDDEPEMSAGGIYKPPSAKEKPMKGTALAVGPGRTLDSGAVLPMPMKQGDLLLFGRYAGTKVELDGQEFLLLTQSDVFAILRRG